MENNEITINGVVIPSKWDDHGNIIGLSIQTNQEEEFFIENQGIGKILFDHVHDSLEITGKTQLRIDGKSTILVENYRKL